MCAFYIHCGLLWATGECRIDRIGTVCGSHSNRATNGVEVSGRYVWASLSYRVQCRLHGKSMKVFDSVALTLIKASSARQLKLSTACPPHLPEPQPMVYVDILILFHSHCHYLLPPYLLFHLFGAQYIIFSALSPCPSLIRLWAPRNLHRESESYPSLYLSFWVSPSFFLGPSPCISLHQLFTS